MDKIKEFIKNNEQEMIDFYKDMHMHPELQMEEFRATDKVCEQLDLLNVEYVRLNPTGLIATINGNKKGKTIALRADMDALNMQELHEDLDFKSLTDGKMHACGHDAHTAMLLTALKSLNLVKDEIEGTIKFFFQPSEENAQGAKMMIEQGALEGVDHVFGIHIWSLLNTGTISCAVGPSFASADAFHADFEGKGGHGALPHNCIDASVMASNFVTNIQSIVSRETNPIDSAVISVGLMDVGTRFNIIAQNAHLEGTVRCFSNETRNRVEQSLQNYGNSIAQMYGGKFKLNYIRATHPVINDKDSALMVHKTVVDSFGEDFLVPAELLTVGEDFSFFTVDIPGSFALVGCRNEDINATYDHHHGLFKVDTDALKYGAELYAKVAVEYLTNN